MMFGLRKLILIFLFCLAGRSMAQVGTLSGWGMAICNVYSFNICPNQTITPFNYGFQGFVCTSIPTLEVSFNIMGPVWRVAKHNYTFTANTNGQISGFDQTNTLQSFTFAANQNINPSSYVTVGTNTFVTFSINNAPTSFSLNQNTFSISIVPVTFSGNTFSTCAATSTGVTISPNVPANGGPWNYNWQPGNMNTNPVTVNPASTTIYTVTATTVVGNCPNTTTVVVTTTNCCNTSAIASASTGCIPSGATTTLSLPSVSGFTPAPSYTWTGPGNFSSNLQTVNFLNNNVYGTYTVNISNGPCSFSTTVATSPLSQFTPVITNTSVLCFGTNSGQANTTVSGGASPFTYTWSSSPSQNNSTATNLAAGIYTCSVTDALGCTFSAVTQIAQPSPLSLNINSNTTNCIGQPVTLFGSAGGGVGPYTYTWTAGPNTSTYTTTQNLPGNYTYSLIAKDANGCSISSSKTIAFSNNGLQITVNSATVCEGKLVNLNANGANTYVWSPAAAVGNSFSFIANANATFTVVGSSNGCTGSAVATVSVNPIPTASINGSYNGGCAPYCIDLNASTTGSVLLYDWKVNNNSVNSSNAILKHCFTLPGTFSLDLLITSVNGCVGSINTFTIPVHPKPVADFRFSSSFLIDDPGISFTDASYDDIISWFWEFGDGTTSNVQDPKHDFEQTYTYNTYLVVQNSFGCADTAHKSIDFEELPTLYVPHSFTPNEDGLNDRFFAKGVGIKTFHMQIFDRWGEKIFECDSFEGSWDGTCKGEPVKQDSYVWKITFSSREYKTKTITGEVVLIK